MCHPAHRTDILFIPSLGYLYIFIPIFASCERRSGARSQRNEGISDSICNISTSDHFTESQNRLSHRQASVLSKIFF